MTAVIGPQRKSTRRRGRGEGTVYQIHEQRKGGGISTYWRAAFKTRSGKRKVVCGHDKAAAMAALEEAKRKDCGGFDVFVDQHLTTAAWLEMFTDVIQKPRWKPATFNLSVGLRKNHIEPRIGSIPLARLTASHIETDLLEAMARDGAGGRTCQQAHAFLGSALRSAVQRGHIAKSPIEFVSRPRHDAKPIAPLSVEQSHRFIAAAAKERYGAIFIVAIVTGMRLGELLALRWPDVDLKARTLSVRHSLSHGPKGTVTIADTKTTKSRRLVTLSKIATEALSAQRELLLSCGIREPDGFVFAMLDEPRGRPIRKEFAERRVLKRILKAAECPTSTTFHTLRHTHATLLLARGVHPKIVSAALGHSKIATTLDTYSHLMPGMAEQAMNELDRALGATDKLRLAVADSAPVQEHCAEIRRKPAPNPHCVSH